MNHRRFAISAITFVISFANALVFYSYPFLLGALKISNGIAGIVVGVASCLTMVCRLASGVYMDKVGGRYVMTIITAAYVIFFAILSSPFVQLVMLGRSLRDAGLTIDTGRTALAVQALGLVALDRCDDVRDALEAVWVSREEDRDVFLQVFDAHWRRWTRAPHAEGPAQS